MFGGPAPGTSRASASSRLPDDIERKIVQIVKDEYPFPKKLPVVQLPEVYQQKFKETLRPEDYGFKTLDDMLKTIREVYLKYDETLGLSFIRFMSFSPNVGEGQPSKAYDHQSSLEVSNRPGPSRSMNDDSEDYITLGEMEDLECMSMEPPSPRTPAGSDKYFSMRSKIPPPSPSVSSTASSMSNASGAPRTRRLPPPPPSMDWSYGTRSIQSKRKGNFVGPDAKRVELDDEHIDESVPPQDRRKLERDQKNYVQYIGYSQPFEKLTYDSLILGKKLGVVEPATYVDTTFCRRATLEHLMEVKYEIRSAGASKYTELQNNLNAFSYPPTAFQFDSAYLYANLDALSGFAITNPCSSDGESLVGNSEILYAVDIHGGPGGFVEYMLTKRKWEAKVYGFTFRDDLHNYKLSSTGHYPKESFEQWFGFDGKIGDGSIFKPAFVDAFCGYLWNPRKMNLKGVHVVIADGMERTLGLDEDRKELRCKSLFLAEAYIAVRLLRKGGTFVMRLYDIFTPYTAGLVYLLYRSFGSVAIVRPETARQGSAERFLICKNYIKDKTCSEIENFLKTCHEMAYGCQVNQKSADEDQAEIVEFVPLETLQKAQSFFNYIYESNCDIGAIQLEETHSLCRAIINRHEGRLIKERRTCIRNKCANEWNCPRQLRQEPRYGAFTHELYLTTLLKPYPENILFRTEREGELRMTYSVMEESFLTPNEWHFVSVGRDRGFYMGRGGDKVYRFFGGEWKPTRDAMDIADQTLVFGDFVDEIQELKGNRQATHTSFHIIDGMVLGGKDIRNLPYEERKFAKSMSKPSNVDFVLVRAKPPQKVAELEDTLKEVSEQQVRGFGDKRKLPLALYDTPDFSERKAHHANTGYLFLKTTKTTDVQSDFLTTMQNRIYWKLGDKTDRNPNATPAKRPTDPRLLSATTVDAPTLVAHINRFSGHGHRFR